MAPRSDPPTPLSATGARAAIAMVVVGCAALVAGNLAGLGTISALAKVAASTGFVALALFRNAHGGRYGKIILLGLGFSWLGDVFLLGSSGTAFLFGLVSFLLAHLAYVAGFSAHGVDRQWAYRALAPVAAASAGALWWLLPYVPAHMTIPVSVYVLVISLMVVAAIGTRGAGGTRLIPVGAVLFYVSDLSVAAGQFVKPDFPNYVWGLPFYYAGQTLLALSVGTRARPVH